MERGRFERGRAVWKILKNPMAAADNLLVRYIDDTRSSLSRPHGRKVFIENIAPKPEKIGPTAAVLKVIARGAVNRQQRREARMRRMH